MLGLGNFSERHLAAAVRRVGARLLRGRRHFVFREVLGGVRIVPDGLDRRFTLFVTRPVPSCQSFSQTPVDSPVSLRLLALRPIFSTVAGWWH